MDNACGAFIFSIDEKTKQKNLDKIKAIHIAGTRAHIFCHATYTQKKELLRSKTELRFSDFFENNNISV